MEDEQIPKTLLEAMFSALGTKYAVLLPIAGVFCFVITVITLRRGHGPFAGATIILAAITPIVVGLYGAVDDLFMFYALVGQAVHPPDATVVAQELTHALMKPLFGMFVAGPTYLVALIGSFVRSLTASARPA